MYVDSGRPRVPTVFLVFLFVAPLTVMGSLPEPVPFSRSLRYFVAIGTSA